MNHEIPNGQVTLVPRIKMSDQFVNIFMDFLSGEEEEMLVFGCVRKGYQGLL
jgi:hypothetical protein